MFWLGYRSRVTLVCFAMVVVCALTTISLTSSGVFVTSNSMLLALSRSGHTMKSRDRHHALEEYHCTDPRYATFRHALGMKRYACVVSIFMTVSVVFLVAKSEYFVAGCVFVRACASATVRV
jgi:hypothetical protein